jgi:hypothetical protein
VLSPYLLFHVLLDSAILSGMFIKQQPKPEQNGPQDNEPAVEPALPTFQAPEQTDDAYRLVLIAQIAEIDRTKRDIKAQIHSHAITAKEERLNINQVWLRRAKDKMDHLTREREEIRKALHTVNERIKESRRSAQRPKDKQTIHQVFMQVAKERLPLDLYESLMDEAGKRTKGDSDSPEAAP